MAYGLYSLEIVFRSWAQGSIENLECGIPGHDRRGNQACHEIRQLDLAERTQIKFRVRLHRAKSLVLPFTSFLALDT